MSAIRLDQPIYYGPGYHTQRTIIVDEQIDSPETLTIRLEEEAARDGGGLHGGSPTGLLPMSTYKSQLHGYADSPYSPYSPHSFSAQQTDNAASHLNQMAFAANSAATGHYLAAQTPSINVLSCHPNMGSQGSRVSLKVSSQFDLVSSTMTASAPFVSISFGSERCVAQILKGSQDSNGACTYTVTAEAPQFLLTSCPSLSNVPLTLLVESSNGEEIARVNNAGVFSYHDPQGGAAGGSVGIGGSGDTSPPDLGSPKRSPVQRASPPHQSLHVQSITSSSSAHHGQSSCNDQTTNTYGFPPGVSPATSGAQAQTHAPGDYTATTAGGYNQGSSNMLGAYRTASFTDHYSRAPPVLRSPHGAGWSPFGTHLDPIRSPGTTIPHVTHTTITRPSMTSLDHSNSNPATPRLIRTSTIQQPSGAGPGYNSYPLFHSKATLKIAGDLGSMAENWTPEEWANKRRLVMFRKSQSGSVLTASFSPVSVSERPPNSICISCIWWAEKQECFVTSVDTIHLLEQLLAAPTRFSVEEKNRIRRNLEGYHPLTVSKAKAESEEFFKIIMTFPNPKPRNIEKDVKVFPWKSLTPALKKIVGKFSASLSSIDTGTNSLTPILTPGINTSYPALPPTPSSASSTSAAESSATGYISTVHHPADSVASPRPLPGVSSWTAYGTSARTMSPALKTSSPVTTSGLRMTTTLAAYDSRGAMQNLTSPYSMSSSSHHSPHHSQGGYSQSTVPVSQSHTRSWENYSVADGYSTPTSQAHGQVYGGGAYGDGTQRA
ncbi:hypothetical protein B0H66DRAFT_538849 [Apodospora peruviana]|uniref:DUF7082 domain-containing protein n=1 Tax=Apodospora peruviana TaxID=516989 RepID=A0AAE0HTZ5_9PEZI|nr:hypothetical protein B0H66DRAFT_538849 [Apodospora peruviana]